MHSEFGFPNRPLNVRLEWKHKLALLGAALFVAGMLAMALFSSLRYGLELVRDAQIWEKGEFASVLSTKGRCQQWFGLLPLTACSVNVAYGAPDGQRYSIERSALVFAGLDTGREPQVKVHPQDFQSASLSWFAEVQTERWIVIVGLSLLCLGLAGTVSGMLVRSLSEWRLYQAMAREPKTIAVTVVDLRHISNPEYAREYKFRYTVNGVEREARQQLAVLKGAHGIAPENWEYDDPIFVAGTKKALALLGPRDQALLVPRSFRPLVLTESEKQRVLALAH